MNNIYHEFRVRKIDCTEYPEECKIDDIHRYPTLRLYTRDENFEVYMGMSIFVSDFCECINFITKSILRCEKVCIFLGRRFKSNLVEYLIEKTKMSSHDYKNFGSHKHENIGPGCNLEGDCFKKLTFFVHSMFSV